MLPLQIHYLPVVLSGYQLINLSLACFIDFIRCLCTELLNGLYTTIKLVVVVVEAMSDASNRIQTPIYKNMISNSEAFFSNGAL